MSSGSTTSTVPTSHFPLLDDSASVLTRGYGFGSRIWRRAREGARAVPMRLLGSDTLLVRGKEGVKVFYDESLISRHGAMPGLIQETLFGHASVHSLDGAEHKHRKSAFLDIAYEDEQVRRLTPLFQREWQAELDAWLAGGTRSAYDAAVGAYGRASMRWAGLPGTAEAKTRWAGRLAQIVDGFGAPYSPEYLLAFANRKWSRRRARDASRPRPRRRSPSGRRTATRRASCCPPASPASSCRTASAP